MFVPTMSNRDDATTWVPASCEAIPAPRVETPRLLDAPDGSGLWIPVRNGTAEIPVLVSTRRLADGSVEVLDVIDYRTGYALLSAYPGARWMRYCAPTLPAEVTP